MTTSEASALRERIAGLFLAKLHLDIPAADADLFDTGVLDSFAFVELLLLLEREFGVKVSVDDLEIENFRSIARIAEFVMTQTGARPNAAGPRPASEDHGGR